LGLAGFSDAVFGIVRCQQLHQFSGTAYKMSHGPQPCGTGDFYARSSAHSDQRVLIFVMPEMGNLLFKTGLKRWAA
jgi:hypothetical protein